ncbi:MAG: hypothetical protein BWY09_00984 [Candidatus Hydrogenedentes bacterium ADurb.Bin179]|nr:MAG: hypothetical protein BWY09_00984 [Candidatus Hydrogenedentes bacterium ADurb.Bin179]
MHGRFQAGQPQKRGFDRLPLAVGFGPRQGVHERSRQCGIRTPGNGFIRRKPDLGHGVFQGIPYRLPCHGVFPFPQHGYHLRADVLIEFFQARRQGAGNRFAVKTAHELQRRARIGAVRRLHGLQQFRQRLYPGHARQGLEDHGPVVGFQLLLQRLPAQGGDTLVVFHGFGKGHGRQQFRAQTRFLRVIIRLCVQAHQGVLNARAFVRGLRTIEQHDGSQALKPANDGNTPHRIVIHLWVAHIRLQYANGGTVTAKTKLFHEKAPHVGMLGAVQRHLENPGNAHAVRFPAGTDHMFGQAVQGKPRAGVGRVFRRADPVA